MTKICFLVQFHFFWFLFQHNAAITSNLICQKSNHGIPVKLKKLKQCSKAKISVVVKFHLFWWLFQANAAITFNLIYQMNSVFN